MSWWHILFYLVSHCNSVTRIGTLYPYFKCTQKCTYKLCRKSSLIATLWRHSTLHFQVYFYEKYILESLFFVLFSVRARVFLELWWFKFFCWWRWWWGGTGRNWWILLRCIGLKIRLIYICKWWKDIVKLRPNQTAFDQICIHCTIFHVSSLWHFFYHNGCWFFLKVY